MMNGRLWTATLILALVSTQATPAEAACDSLFKRPTVGGAGALALMSEATLQRGVAKQGERETIRSGAGGPMYVLNGMVPLDEETAFRVEVSQLPVTLTRYDFSELPYRVVRSEDLRALVVSQFTLGVVRTDKRARRGCTYRVFTAGMSRISYDGAAQRNVTLAAAVGADWRTSERRHLFFELAAQLAKDAQTDVASGGTITLRPSFGMRVRF